MVKTHYVWQLVPLETQETIRNGKKKKFLNATCTLLTITVELYGLITEKKIIMLLL